MAVMTHYTHPHNIVAIAAEGLRPDRATGLRQAVYLVDGRYRGWAHAHAARRHGWDAADMVEIIVNVSDLPIRATSLAGRYYATEVIPPDRLFLRDSSGSRTLVPLTKCDRADD